jgi:hypothetical protein
MEAIVAIYPAGGLRKTTKIAEDIAKLPDDLGTEGLHYAM